jgi:hypothetical protein
MIRGPSEKTTIAFLAYLRENNYIAKSGIEYSKDEVDQMYFEKCTRLGEKEAHKAFKKRYKAWRF